MPTFFGATVFFLTTGSPATTVGFLTSHSVFLMVFFTGFFSTFSTFEVPPRDGICHATSSNGIATTFSTTFTGFTAFGAFLAALIFLSLSSFLSFLSFCCSFTLYNMTL